MYVTINVSLLDFTGMNVNSQYRHIALICLLYLFQASVILAAGPARSNDRSGMPINVKSNEMTADSKGKTALFSGKVVAKQGDITIFSDKLAVTYADKGGDVEKVEASGNVRIIQLNKTGFADHAVYESAKGRIILTGNPRVVQGNDSISGKVITYYVDEDRSDVSSGGDPKARVEAVINPSARKKDAGTR